jgi:hypothetical protein
VTVGQIAPGTITSCSNSFEFLEASTPDNSYAMPAAGTITSWTHHSQAGTGQTPTLKIFRKLSDPATYTVVGHDGPHPIAANTVATFPASIPVKAGDVLGITGAGGAVNIGCEFSGPGEDAFRSGNLADDAFGDFTVGSMNRRINASAVLEPTNSFTVGGITRNKKNGTATLTLTFPNPGQLTASGAGVLAASVSVAGTAQLPISATGKKRKKLRSKGKATLSVALIYTPTGGDPSSQSVNVNLKKNRKKKKK